MSGRPSLTSYPLRQKTEHSRCFTLLPNKLVTSCSLPARLVRAGQGLALFPSVVMITKQAKMTQSRPGVTEVFFNELYSMLLNRATLRVDITLSYLKKRTLADAYSSLTGRLQERLKTEGIGRGEQILI